MHDGLPVKVCTPFSRGTDDGVAGEEEGGEGGVRAGIEEGRRVRSGKRALEREVVRTSEEGGRVEGAEVKGGRVEAKVRVDVGKVVEDDVDENGRRVSPSVDGETEVSGENVEKAEDEGRVEVRVKRSESSWSWKMKQMKKKERQQKMMDGEMDDAWEGKWKRK